jgi:hypothetical protein
MKILLVVLLTLIFGSKIMVIGQDTVVMEASVPAADTSIGPGRPATKPPQGYLSLESNENNATLGKIARSLLGGDYGTMTPFHITDADGKTRRYMARVDAHYHAPPPAGTPQEEMAKYPKPWGWHKGVTIYKADPSKNSIEDYVPESPENPRMKFLQRIDQFYEQFGIKPN